MGKDIDKITRDSFAKLILNLAEDFLGLKVLDISPLPEIGFLRLERNLDSVWHLREKSGREVILHLEFQTRDHADMNMRMREYHTVLVSRYRLPVRQLVFYLGKKPSKMEPVAPEGFNYEGFELIEFRNIPYEKLLQIPKAEAGVLSILGNFGNTANQDAIANIIKHILQFQEGPEKTKLHLNDLEVLGNLRNLGVDVVNNNETMPFEIDWERVPSFRRGLEKGRKEGIRQAQAMAIYALYLRKILSNRELAEVFNLPEEEVDSIVDAEGKVA